MFRRLVVIFVVCALFLGVGFNIVSAQQAYPRIYFFYSDYCGHCHDEIAFLEELIPVNSAISLAINSLKKGLLRLG